MTITYAPVSHTAIRDLIAKFQPSDGADFAATADSVVRELLSMPSSDARDAIFPLVYGEARLAYREFNRSNEPRGSGGPVSDPVKPRADLLNRAYYCGSDVGYVELGDATKEDHMARESYLEAQAAGYRKSASWHGTIARVLRKSGAATLRGLRKIDPSAFVKLMDGEP